MPNGHGRTVPTMQELKRGIYLDFEGNMNQQPTLLGTMKDDQSDFVIVKKSSRTVQSVLVHRVVMHPSTQVFGP